MILSIAQCLVCDTEKTLKILMQHKAIHQSFIYVFILVFACSPYFLSSDIDYYMQKYIMYIHTYMDTSLYTVLFLIICVSYIHFVGK